MTAPKPRLRDVEARSAAATEGPWLIVEASSWRTTFVEMPSEDRAVLSVHAKNEPDDLEFIAASRTDVPALTAAIRAVLAMLDPAGTSIRPLRRYDSDSIRAALSAHIDLEES